LLGSGSPQPFRMDCSPGLEGKPSPPQQPSSAGHVLGVGDVGPAAGLSRTCNRRVATILLVAAVLAGVALVMRRRPLHGFTKSLRGPFAALGPWIRHAGTAGSGWGRLPSVERKNACQSLRPEFMNRSRLLTDVGARRNLAFVHIPKTGGRAIESAAKAASVHWGQEYWKDWRSDVGMSERGHRCSAWHVPPAYLHPACSPYVASDVFCVVREPVHRAVSEFRYHVDWWLVNRNTQIPCTEQELNRFIAQSMDSVEDGDEFIDDCHWIPQSHYIWGPDGTQWCSHVLKFESLSDEFRALMASQDLRVQLPERDSNSEFSSKRLCDVTVDMLSTDNKARLRRHFARDFSLLGYP